MGFNSFFFIFCFLPASIIGYFAFNRIKKYTLANVYLIILSILFVGYINIFFAAILFLSIVVNYLIGKLIIKNHKTECRKIILCLGIAFNVGLLLYFKYYNFFVESINLSFGLSLVTRKILLPLGISFYTFQQIAYLVDSHRAYNDHIAFCDYALSVAFFPHVSSGPIFVHNQVIDQFKDINKRTLNYYNLSAGLYFFSIGLFKKVILADNFANAVNWGFSNTDVLSSLDIFIVSLCYTFQLYFDFSGYCDMAMGTSKMFNIDLPINFNSPYKSTSIIEFWEKWHISLTAFLREYIYFPLGGSKKGTIRTYINIMVVFLVSGFWHGANYTFIVWGLAHGFLNCVNRIFMKAWEKANVVFRWAVTFTVVDLLWLVFRADSVSQFFQLLKRMIRLDSLSINPEIVNAVTLKEFRVLETYPLPGAVRVLVAWLRYLSDKIYGFNLWAILTLSFFIVLNLKNLSQITFKNNIWRTLITVVLLVWSIVSFTGVITYIYAGF